MALRPGLRDPIMFFRNIMGVHVGNHLRPEDLVLERVVPTDAYDLDKAVADGILVTPIAVVDYFQNPISKKIIFVLNAARARRRLTTTT